MPGTVQSTSQVLPHLPYLHLINEETDSNPTWFQVQALDYYLLKGTERIAVTHFFRFYKQDLI